LESQVRADPYFLERVLESLGTFQTNELSENPVIDVILLVRIVNCCLLW